MTDVAPNQPRHFIALGAGVVALLVFVFGPTGMVGYLLAIAVAVAAVLVGHSASRHRGRMLVLAIIGLVISYFVLLTAVALLVVHMTRLFG